MDMRKYDFTKSNVDKSPAEAGVYILYAGETIIYIGRAQGGSTTIRSRLQRHESGAEGSCTQKATAYSRMVTDDSVNLEVELLEWHETSYGKLPRCNSRVG